MATVLGLFRSSYELEKAVTQLLSQQFQGSQIRVVTMQMTEAAPKPKGLAKWLMGGGFLGDTLDRSDGTSLMDGTIACAIVGGLSGVIAGAAMLPGPIALGVAGIAGGGVIGYLLDRLIPENRRQEYAKALQKGCTVVAVRCHNEEQRKAAELILRENQAHEMGQM